MGALALDLSNYSTPLNATRVRTLKRAGIRHAIVQAIEPPAGYPPSQTRAQIQTCLKAGLTVDAYLYLWFDQDDIQSKLSLLDGLPIRTIWLDVEDAAARKYTQAQTEAIVQAALDKCDAYGTWLDRPKGIYTGRWYWASPLYLADSATFADRPLWDAHYDSVANANVGFEPYGGWTGCAVKQFAGTSTVGGVGGVDRNVLSDSESTLLVRA